MLRALVLSLSLFVQGCKSMYVYPDLEDKPGREGAGSKLSRLILGVEANPDNFDYGRRVSKPERPFDLQTLIDALNEYRVFEEVGYVGQLHAKPDLILKEYRHANPEYQGVHG